MNKDMSEQVNCGFYQVEDRMIALLGGGPLAFCAKYHLDGGGERSRALLALDATAALGLSGSVALSCACASELLHNASLVHDDLQERDAIRRGRPAVWRHFNTATAICVGDLMISAAYASLASHPRAAAAIALTHDAVSETARGQTEEIQTSQLSVADYRLLAELKTGALLALPVRLALCAADELGDADAIETGRQIAIAYQMLDDLNDRDADRMAGRVNICTLLERAGYPPEQATMLARREACQALNDARASAELLPRRTGVAFRNLADRLASKFMEFSDAA